MIRKFIYGFLFGLIFNFMSLVFILFGLIFNFMSLVFSLAIKYSKVVKTDEFEIKTIGFLIGIICNIVIIVLLSK